MTTTDPFCQGIERALRRGLYQWDHFACDMVMAPVFVSGYAITDTGFGLQERAVRSGMAGGSADYVPIIRDEADVERIQFPQVSVDWKQTERNYQMTCDLLGDILHVRKQGYVHAWCAPWDILIRWWGIEELYRDMMDRPAFVHRGIGRMMDAMLARLDQWVEVGALSLGNGNHRVGSGGLGITDELPSPGYDGVRARPMDHWGTCTGQIFSEVSPPMHDEFCLQYERRWLERFGLNCYGCCEPLHNKIGILRSVPRLRRVSMSTWINVDKAAQEVGRDYVFSYKPNPAFLAGDAWNPDPVRRNLREVLEKTRGCVVELILKDISTVRNDPTRLDAWAAVAMETAEAFG
jgi:hypothetical protein